MKPDFNFQFFGIEVGTNPFILDGLGMTQASPYILGLDEVCRVRALFGHCVFKFNQEMNSCCQEVICVFKFNQEMVSCCKEVIST